MSRKYHKRVGGKVEPCYGEPRPQPLCRRCGLAITFRKFASGSWQPQNPDGSDHWDDCARQHSQPPRVEFMAKTVATDLSLPPWCGVCAPWGECSSSANCN